MKKKIKIEKNIPLRDLTTFHVGGAAGYFCEVKKSQELIEAVRFAKKRSLPIFVLGGGSNILVSDKGFPGLVLRYIDSSFYFNDVGDDVLVSARAGMVWDDLVKVCVEKNLQGIECLSGIPGLVGATPIQNIGAYGQELKDVFVSLKAYDFKLEKFVIFDRERCKFSYRESVFKNFKNRGRYIITEITLKLKKEASPTLTYQSLKDYLTSKKIVNPSLLEVREAVLDLRAQKLELPDNFGNAGSFFKNPIVSKSLLNKLLKKYPDLPYYDNGLGKYKLFAGWFIEKAGWKGKQVGGAMVSKKNALVITNFTGWAKAEEIIKLSEKIESDIKKKFGVTLEREVQFIE